MLVIKKLYVYISVIVLSGLLFFYITRFILDTIEPVIELQRINFNNKLDIVTIRPQYSNRYLIYLIDKDKNINNNDCREKPNIIFFKDMDYKKFKFRIDDGSITIIIPKDEYEIGKIPEFNNYTYADGKMIKIYNKIE